MAPLQLCKVTLALILIFGSIPCGFGIAIGFGDSRFFSVCDYGAVGDGLTEDTGAFLDAWQATCGTQFENPTMIVPNNFTFLVHQLTFSGPCNTKNITFLVLGNNIKAPASPRAWTDLDPSSWITFGGIDQLHATGFGTIDGQGSEWWNQSCRYHSHLVHKNFQVCFSLYSFSGGSDQAMNCNFSGRMHFSGTDTPCTSPNTDGIHIQSSQHVSITNRVIGTGDDCISIGDYISNVYVSSVTCGPGHGVR
ncbi:probable polygalacturonase At1g80170 [Rhodamnia argentea]|uniref:Probable polygalacturonase At1g80170 n=1 Tax=Rhodamnia argentea TaxID=178133 RepID=A0ABM3HBS6_9MYRT|nr:probable polygalacturonase At1g80170 [Rhodamnia argentea]